MTRRLALALWLTALACAAAAVVLVVRSDHEDSPLLTGLIAPSVGIAFVTAGLVAWLRRPRNRTGALLTMVGFTWYLGALTLADDSIPFTAGLLLNNLVFGFFAWLVLAFPTGELGSRLNRLVAGATFLLATVGQAGYLLVYDPRESACPACPPNRLLATHNDSLETAVRLAIDVTAVAVAFAFVTILARRWHRAAPATRRMLTPVYATAGVTAVLIVVNFVAVVASGVTTVGFWPIVYVALLTVPLAFIYALLRTRLAQADAGRLLLLQTPDEPTPHEAENALRRTLQDPTLELAYWLQERDGYVDADGNPFELPSEGDERAVTRIEYEDRPVAAMVHDPALREEPELIESVVATVRVAIEKDRSVQALRESERRRRALLDAMPDNMFRVTRGGDYLGANIKDERYLPISSEELEGRNVRDILPPQVAEIVLAGVARALDSGAPQTVEYRMRRPIGIRDSEARIVASGDDEAVIIVRDITQRKYQEALLEAERDFIRTVVDGAPAIFAVVDAEGGVVRFNDALAGLCGFADTEEVRGTPFWEAFVTTADTAAVQARFAEAMESEQSPRHEHRWRSDDAREPACVEWSVTRLPDQAGQRRYLISGLDVTARRLQEQELRRLYAELESRNRELQRERDFANTIADTTPSLLCVVTAEGRIVPHGVNPAFEELLGWTEEEVTGRTFDELVLPEGERARFPAVLAWVRAGGAGGEMETDWTTRGGESVSIAWTLTPLQDRRAQQWYLISGSDVTERRRQAQELRELYEELEERNRQAERERDFLNAIANNAPSMLCLVDETGTVAPRASNRAFEEVLEYDPEDTGGGTFWDRYVVPEEAEEVRQRIMRVVAGEPLGEHDSTWVTSTGHRLPVAWSCTPMPQLDDRTLFLITGVDVSERKRQEEELRASRQRIVEAGDAERRRLERNLHDGAQQRLVAISISLRLAKARLRTDPPTAGPLLQAAAEELAHALEELRELARGIHPAVLTDRGLHPALVAVASRSPVPVALDVTEERMPGPVEAAAYYVVSEALANVAKYAEASTVSVRVARLNGRALVEVADDGIGGADPTTGTGLRGLADRVSALDGRLDVESAPRRGTRIRAEIPLV